MLDVDEIVEELTKLLGCSSAEILSKVQKLIEENQRLKDKIKALKEFVDECVTYRG